MKKERTHLTLTPSLKAALRKRCKNLGIAMTDFIESLVSKALKKN